MASGVAVTVGQLGRVVISPAQALYMLSQTLTAIQAVNDAFQQRKENRAVFKELIQLSSFLDTVMPQIVQKASQLDSDARPALGAASA